MKKSTYILSVAALIMYLERRRPNGWINISFCCDGDGVDHCSYNSSVENVIKEIVYDSMVYSINKIWNVCGMYVMPFNF